MKSIAAVVVLFNPNVETIENIQTYCNDVKIVFAIDNTENEQNYDVINKLKEIKNLRYYHNRENLGIANALNIGVRFSIKENCNYILTMDQDSKATPGMVKNLYRIIAENEKIALISANHFNPQIHSINSSSTTEEVLYTMTSGNILNTKIFNEVGGFKDELFIDYVDHEYCLRLNKNGYKVLKSNQFNVVHTLGKAEKKKFLYFNLYPTHHSPERLYYRTRNRLFVNKLYKQFYPEYVKQDYINQVKELIYIILAEKNRISKMKMMVKGYFDYKKNKFGKYNS